MTTPHRDDKTTEQFRIQNSTEFSTDMHFIINTVHMTKNNFYFCSSKDRNLGTYTLPSQIPSPLKIMYT